MYCSVLFRHLIIQDTSFFDIDPDNKNNYNSGNLLFLKNLLYIQKELSILQWLKLVMSSGWHVFLEKKLFMCIYKRF
jgi:hypothetical protein